MSLVLLSLCVAACGSDAGPDSRSTSMTTHTGDVGDGTSGSIPDPALIEGAAEEVQALVADESGYAGTGVDRRLGAVVVYWAGSIPASLRERMDGVAAPVPVRVEKVAVSLADLRRAMDQVSTSEKEKYSIVALTPDAREGKLIIGVDRENELLRSDRPASLLGIKGVMVQVELMDEIEPAAEPGSS